MKNTATIVPSGELAIQFQPGFLEAAGFKEGNKVNMRVDGQTIVVEKLVNVELDLDDEVLVKLALLAHEKDITLNQVMVEILENAIANSNSEV